MVSKKTYTVQDAKKLLRSRNSWWTGLVVEPLVTLTLPIVANKTNLTPNQITLISLLFGFLAAALFYEGSYLALAVGALSYQVSFYLDCLDGSIARLKGLTSTFGAMLDTFTDFFSITFISTFLGLSFWLKTADDRILVFTIIFLVTSFYYRLSSAWLMIYLKDEYEKSILDTGKSLTIFKWMKQHRLANFPSSVDAETLTLFFAPILNQPLVGFILGSALMFFHCFRNTYKLFLSLKK